MGKDQERMTQKNCARAATHLTREAEAVLMGADRSALKYLKYSQANDLADFVKYQVRRPASESHVECGGLLKHKYSKKSLLQNVKETKVKVNLDERVTVMRAREARVKQEKWDEERKTKGDMWAEERLSKAEKSDVERVQKEAKKALLVKREKIEVKRKERAVKAKTKEMQEKEKEHKIAIQKAVSETATKRAAHKSLTDLKKGKELQQKDKQDKRRVSFVGAMEKQEKKKKEALKGLVEKDAKKKQVARERLMDVNGESKAEAKKSQTKPTMSLKAVKGDKLLSRLWHQEQELQAKLQYKTVWNQMQGKIAKYSAKLSGLEEKMVGMPEVPVGYAEIVQARKEREKDREAVEVSVNEAKDEGKLEAAKEEAAVAKENEAEPGVNMTLYA